MIHGVILLRHASAGDRRAWTGDDRLRPLDNRGRRQALRLAERLALLAPSAIRSSPYIRCLETVAPLASELGLVIEEDEEFAEGVAPHDAILSLQAAGSSVLVCTHGDVIEAVLGAGLKKAAAVVLEPRSLRRLATIDPP